jgi:hypothetical protein
MGRKQINQIKPVRTVLAAILLLAFGMSLYSSAIVVYAQQDLFPNIILPPKNTSQTNNKITAQQTTTTLSSLVAHGIKITSPVSGQHLPVGSLTVSGISNDNATANCQVYVIANNLRPYQNASGAGPDGKNDYSRWNFILTSKYTLIKEGVNKITAKFSCKPNSTIAAFYSINVTGIAGTKNQSGVTSNTSTRSNATIVSDLKSTKGSKLLTTMTNPMAEG